MTVPILERSLGRQRLSMFMGAPQTRTIKVARDALIIIYVGLANRRRRPCLWRLPKSVAGALDSLASQFAGRLVAQRRARIAG